MAEEETEFKIKGAASNKSSSSRGSISSSSDRADEPTPTAADDDTKTPVAEAEEVQQTSKKRKADDVEPSDEELKEKYKWWKCPADPAQYPPESFGTHYWTHTGGEASRWEEPDEPYWIYDVATGQADPAGLQEPKKKKKETPTIPEGYQGYNPKIHGNFDPNADYAKYHLSQPTQEQSSDASSAAAPTYDSVVALNARTGHAQRSDLGPERHSDGAKAHRQMGAFFDVDAAANAHGGQSLKKQRQERTQQLPSKEIRRLAQAKKEKKKRKQMDFLKS